MEHETVGLPAGRKFPAVTERKGGACPSRFYMPIRKRPVGATCGRPRGSHPFHKQFRANPCAPIVGRPPVGRRVRAEKRRAQATRPTAKDSRLRICRTIVVASDRIARTTDGRPYGARVFKHAHPVGTSIARPCGARLKVVPYFGESGAAEESLQTEAILQILLYNQDLSR